LSAEVAVLQYQKQGLEKAIQLQKKKNKQGVRLNLYREPNKDIVDCYSPVQVVKAREYQEQKEVLKAAEEEAKYQRKVQQAANTLKRVKEREEKDTRAAARQLVKDLKGANPTDKKASTKQPKSVALKAKKAAPTVPKTKKVSTKAKPTVISKAKRVVIILPEEVVVSEVAVTNRKGCAIRLLQCYI
jgi:hypothetical protein